MQKLFLLDAYALIYRAYYALIRSPRMNSKGENTSAVYGFVNTLEEVLQKQAPTHIAVAFDPSGPTFRHDAYPEYKAQREETPEDIRRAVPVIKDIIRAYNIPILEVPGFEADDVIGTVARRAAEAGLEVRMITPDKDYAQLVGEHVKMCRPGHGSAPMEVLGVEEVCEKYSLTSPLQVIDLLGLMGDSADNIPGCPGGGGENGAETHCAVWLHRKPSQQHRPAQGRSQKEGGGECGANSLLAFPRHHQDRRAARCGDGIAQTH